MSTHTATGKGTARSTPSQDALDSERKHLETLFSNRINFYLVFVGVFATALTKIDKLAIQKGAVIMITLVSLIMAIALTRTYRLVMSALNQLTKEYPDHPYSRNRSTTWLPNANHLLLALPWLLFAGYFTATVYYLLYV